MVCLTLGDIQSQRLLKLEIAFEINPIGQMEKNKTKQDPGKKKGFPRVMCLVKESLTHSVEGISTHCGGQAKCRPLPAVPGPDQAECQLLNCQISPPQAQLTGTLRLRLDCFMAGIDRCQCIPDKPYLCIQQGAICICGNSLAGELYASLRSQIMELHI